MKLKDANDKIEALKKSHQAELEKVESDFANEIKALKSLDQEAEGANKVKGMLTRCLSWICATFT